MDNESRLPKPLYHLFEVTAFGLLVAGSIMDSWATLNLVDIGTNTHLEGQMGLWQACTETCYATVYEGALLTVVLLFCIGGAMCIIPGILMYCYKGKIFYIYGLSQILGDMDNQNRPMELLSTGFQTASTILMIFPFLTNSLATFSLVDIWTNTYLEGHMGLWWACTETCNRSVSEGALLAAEILVLISILIDSLHFLLIAIKRGKYFYMCGPVDLLGGILLAAAMIIFGSKSAEIVKNNFPRYITKSVTLGYTFYFTLATSGCCVAAGLVSFYAAFYSLV